MTRTHGLVALVESRFAGSAIADGTTPGDVELLVNSITDFPPSGQVLVDGTLYAYTSVQTVRNDTAGTIRHSLTLVTGDAALLPGLAVLVSPTVESKVATVVFDADEGGAPVEVPHHYMDLMPEGTEQYPVTLERHSSTDAWAIVGVHRKTPERDAGYITPGTLMSASVDQSDFAATALLPTILNATNTDSGGSGVPLQNIRINNGTANFLVRRNGTGQWPGLDTIPTIITAAYGTGIVVGTTPPSDHTVLWVDTT